FELDDAITGGGEQTLTVQVFRIRKYLRDASMMHDDRRCVAARCDVCSLGERAQIGFKRREKIKPIVNHARHDGSQSRSQAKAIDKLKRREQHPKTTGVWENRADGAPLESIGEAAAMILLDE